MHETRPFIILPVCRASGGCETGLYVNTASTSVQRIRNNNNFIIIYIYMYTCSDRWALLLVIFNDFANHVISHHSPQTVSIVNELIYTRTYIINCHSYATQRYSALHVVILFVKYNNTHVITVIVFLYTDSETLAIVKPSRIIYAKHT